MCVSHELPKRAALHVKQTKYEKKRADLRKMCREMGKPIQRSLSGAVRAGIIQPMIKSIPMKVQTCHIRNPAGVQTRAPDPICRSCGQARSQVQWRRDGSGQFCKRCAAERRKLNRRVAREKQLQSEQL